MHIDMCFFMFMHMRTIALRGSFNEKLEIGSSKRNHDHLRQKCLFPFPIY